MTQVNIQELKNLRINNRNDRIIYNLLSTIIGECEQISKDPSKDQIISIIQKMYKDNNFTLQSLSDDRKELIDTLKKENDYLETFLPKQLSEDELYALINSQIQSGNNMPKVMKYLSENYKGRYDGKTAARICNMLINGTVM